MYHKFLGCFFIFLTLLVCGACQAQNSKNSKKKVKTLRTAYIEPDIYANVPHKLLNVRSNDTFYIEKDIDLGGDVFEIPVGVTLVSKGGVVKNGVLYGNNTTIEKSKPLFENITIRGSWDVRNISTSLFKSLSSDNALRNLIALANPNVYNTIVIEKGDYWFSLVHEAECGLVIPSNTKVILNGNLLLRPNGLKRYYIVYVPSENVSITGKGAVIGDKPIHINNGGEWGMGVRFQRATNCRLSDLSIKDCWGDCICVSRKSKNIEIEKCTLINGRRQGVSVTSADSVLIKDCIIKGVKGTPPGYAVDIEPDSRDTVKHVKIKNLTINNCNGGIALFTGEGKNSLVDNVTISKCTITGVNYAPIKSRGANRVYVDNCVIKNNKAKYSIYVQRSNDVKVSNSTISTDKYVFYDIGNIKVKDNKIVKGTITPPIIKKKIKRILK